MTNHCSYKLSSFLFLRLLAVVYFVAFLSLLTQAKPLYGNSGILPISLYVELLYSTLGSSVYYKYPSIFLFNQSDLLISLTCWLGILFSILAFFKILELYSFFLLWLCYFSFVKVGQIFLSYQWDILLIEIGFLAIFLASSKLTFSLKQAKEPNKYVRILLWLLLFRLMFSSGIVKLNSGDATWWDLTALNFHYYTQPIPNRLAYYFHQLPEFIQKSSVLIMFFIELVVPFGIFGTRQIRYTSGFLLILFQILILISGNYTFFNLLTIALCLLLFDDKIFSHVFSISTSQKIKNGIKNKKLHYTKLAFFFLLCLISLNPVVRTLTGSDLGPIGKVEFYLRRYNLVNPYGLFAVMTTTRPELIIEGSNDGEDWKEYEFYWKPGNTSTAPKQVAPFQPRVDWQLWFAALQAERNYPYREWFIRLIENLLEANPNVLRLVKLDPFNGQKPKMVRIQLYYYEFTDLTEKKSNGNWWKRKFVRTYVGPLALKTN